MTLAQIAILVLCAMGLTLFVWGRWRHDVVALVVLCITVGLGLVQAESLCRFRLSGSHHRGSSAGHSSRRFDDRPARCRGAASGRKGPQPHPQQQQDLIGITREPKHGGNSRFGLAPL